MRCFPFHYKMRCFPCFRFKKLCRRKKHLPTAQAKEIIPTTAPSTTGATSKVPAPEPTNNKVGPEVSDVAVEDGNSVAKTFTFRELATATKNFRQECLLSEGGFGRIFKGTLQPSGQVVAVRQLDRSGTLATKEFLVEVLVLSLLQHPNLVTLLGYCADGDQRLLVYEYMPLGSLDDYLFGTSTESKKLDWSARMKIASGVAEGLEYLNEKANPPIIYRDLKSSNILLDEESNPRLSHFGLDKLVQSGNKMHVTPRVMAAYGYSAPEYERQGELSLKSDVYSFGVVLLELITGRRAFDNSRPLDEQNLVTWAQPFFKDPTSFPEMADPSLGRDFPVTSLNQAVGVAAMCLQEDPSVRPFIGDVVAALSFLMTAPPGGALPKLLSSRIPSNDDDDDCSSSSSSSKYIEFSGRRDCSDSTGVESPDGDCSSGGCDNSKARVRFKDENGNIYSADEIQEDLN